MCGQCWRVFAKNGLVTPRITGGGAWAFVVYSLNSLSWMVKYGRKSEQYINGVIMLQKESCQYFTINQWFCKMKGYYFTYTEIGILDKKTLQYI